MKATRIVRLAAIAAIALLAFSVFQLRYLANRGLGKLVQFQSFGNIGADHLIVVVHAYGGNSENMREVRETLKKSRPDAEILMVQYPAGTWSNADCFKMSSKLFDEIDLRYNKKEGHYKSIEFVGYSMGALLARKCYVYACGRIEDYAPGPGDPDPEALVRTRGPRDWVKAGKDGTDTRFVLFAGMNRGWSTRDRPGGMGLWHQFAYNAGKFIGWATGTGRMIRQCETGEPFVANLRLQWLEAMRNPEIRQPTVIQLLGDTDDIVSGEDSRDASVNKNFIWVQLAGTDHFNATKFKRGLKTAEEKASGLARKLKFREAMGGKRAIARLRRASPALPAADDNDVVEAVVVLHGIRDYGEWTTEFENALQERYMKTHQKPQKLCIYRPKYGYFPMGRFLFWPERHKKVRWFMDEITELKARYPHLDRINFIGHSNGTYILASSLLNYRALSVKRVVFAGSVVRQKFDWTSPALSNRVESVRAYSGSTDWVVGLFPRLFEIRPFTLLGNDIGSAGFNGFTKPDKMSDSDWKQLQDTFLFQTNWVRGGHGTAIEPDKRKIDSIAAFLFDPAPPVVTMEDEIMSNRGRVREKLLNVASIAAPGVWCAIIGLLTLGWVALGRFPEWLKIRMTARQVVPCWLACCDRLSIKLPGIQVAVKTSIVVRTLYAMLILFILLRF
jgi:hypothetical protein